MKDYGIIDSQIKFIDGYTKTLKETAKKSYYKDSVSRFFLLGTYFGTTIDYQQTLINNGLLHGAANSEACATFLKSLTVDTQESKQE